MQKEIKQNFLTKSLVKDNREWKLSPALYIQHTKKATCKTQPMQNRFEYLSYSKYTNM